MPSASSTHAVMQFEIENELLPAGRRRPYNWCKHIVMIVCTAVICVLLIIVDARLESVIKDENRRGCERGLPRSDGPKRQNGALGPTGPLGGVETLNEGIQNLTASKGIAEGIIAGTEFGVFIIPFDPRESRRISIDTTCGVAFNWQSQKVYWIERGAQIKTADLDGYNAEVLILDFGLRGLAVDQITANFYYGETRSDARIRVCDSMGKKCVTVASGVNNVGSKIWDIALLPSEGLMFWSSRGDKRSVTRANMDGTNATVIFVEDVYGLYSDDFTEKLYWVNYYNKSIGHRDLTGHNWNVLLNTTINPMDIAVDGDTLYFGGKIGFDVDAKDLVDGSRNVIYSLTSSGNVSYIANTLGYVYYIAFYGRNKVFSRPNPCKNSPCANLCVLTRGSHACL